MNRTKRWWGPALVALTLMGAASCSEDRDCKLTASCADAGAGAGGGGAAAGGSGAGMNAGGSGGLVVDETPPTLVMTFPSDGAVDVTTRVSLTATFSEPLDPSTVTSSSFVVTSVFGDVIAGVVSYDDSAGATFVPDEPLALLAGHTMTFTAAITDLAGNALADPQSATFSTIDGTWENPQLIETSDAYVVESPQVAISSNGDVVAVWATSPDAFLYASRFSPTTNAWSTPVALDGTNATADPKVAIDGNGNAVAVWRRLGAAVWGSSYEPGVGWSPPVMIQTAGGAGHVPRIAMAANGTATAVWEQDGGGSLIGVWTNTFEVGVGWALPLQLDLSNDAQAPDVAVDEDGYAFVVWRDGNTSTVARRFVLGSGWSQPEIIATNPNYASIPRISVTPSGHAMVVWARPEGGFVHVWSNRYISELGWLGATPFGGSTGGNASHPSVAVDAAANAVGVWPQGGAGILHLWSNATTANGWGTPEPLEVAAGAVESSQVAMDDVGNAMAMWAQSDGTRKSIWSNRRNTAGVWAGASLREMSNAGDADSVQIAVTRRGEAVAVWRQSDGVRFNAWASLFREAPTN